MRDKHLLGSFIYHVENEMLWISPQAPKIDNIYLKSPKLYFSSGKQQY